VATGASDDIMTVRDLAVKYGVTPEAVRQAFAAARRRGAATPQPLKIDPVYGTRFYDPGELETFWRNRPGRGVGGGRPQRKRKTAPDQ